MNDPDALWLRLARGAVVAVLLLVLLRLAADIAGLAWLLLATAGVVALVWHACGAVVRQLLRH